MADEPRTTIKRELVTEPPLSAPVDIAAVLAKRRERAVAEDAARAAAVTPPAGPGPSLTIEEKLALLGLSAEELQAVLKKGEG